MRIGVYVVRYKKGVNLCPYLTTGTAKHLPTISTNNPRPEGRRLCIAYSGCEIGGFVVREQEAKASLYQDLCSVCFVNNLLVELYWMTHYASWANLL